MDEKINTLEIVNGVGEKGLLKKSNLFKEENIIDMALLLNVGQINDLESIETKITCNNEINVKEKIDKLKEILNNYSNVRIWYSSLDSEDYNFTRQGKYSLTPKEFELPKLNEIPENKNSDPVMEIL